VRWTERRNFEAVLDMMADGRLDVKPLISHRFPISEAVKAYDLVTGLEPSLGILLDYPDAEMRPTDVLRRRTVELGSVPSAAGKAVIGFIGSGNYATAVLIPAFKAAGARLATVASSGGVSGLHAGRKFGFSRITTDVASVFDDPEINTVVIATRHDSHADLVCRALRAKKHVFVEKPLALSHEEVSAIDDARREVAETGFTPIIMVGFNRRFAPQVRKIKSLLEGNSSAKSFVMTVNAGAIAADHWTQDRDAGGGRIVGEACHFIDLLRFLAGARIRSHHVQAMETATGDTATLTLSFADGSIGAVHYFANGNRAFRKERLEIFSGGRILQLDNFRRLTGFGWPGFRAMNLWRQDKGQKACAEAFLRAVELGGTAPIPFDEQLEVSRATIEIAAAIRS